MKHGDVVNAELAEDTEDGIAEDEADDPAGHAAEERAENHEREHTAETGNHAPENDRQLFQGSLLRRLVRF